jgi:hypothetical protein
MVHRLHSRGILTQARRQNEMIWSSWWYREEIGRFCSLVRTHRTTNSALSKQGVRNLPADVGASAIHRLSAVLSAILNSADDRPLYIQRHVYIWMADIGPHSYGEQQMLTYTSVTDKKAGVRPVGRARRLALWHVTLYNTGLGKARWWLGARAVDRGPNSRLLWMYSHFKMQLTNNNQFHYGH